MIRNWERIYGPLLITYDEKKWDVGALIEFIKERVNIFNLLMCSSYLQPTALIKII